MDIALAVIGAILMVLSIVGCIAPVLPSVPLAYVGLIVLQISAYGNFSTSFLVIWAVVTVLITILNYIIPALGAKKLGGSKYGERGCFIGTIIGVFFGPLGIIIGPFVGAVVGELLAGKDIEGALKSGLGSFLGFIASTFINLLACVAMSIFYFTEMFGNM
ncbi:MAG: DUF456 domain-containing protein [Paludibacteraceae bacterium]|nr:DUF456 domain-containing protein [Paludibacteraceae bacterium]MBP5136479.1 DUF456 domain-containing protein [Paludibacteraceae bacterium]MBP5741926.1 DUF456 domain-containing protein [Paludibacteraceae bacterium]